MPVDAQPYVEHFVLFALVARIRLPVHIMTCVLCIFCTCDEFLGLSLLTVFAFRTANAPHLPSLPCLLLTACICKTDGPTAASICRGSYLHFYTSLALLVSRQVQDISPNLQTPTAIIMDRRSYRPGCSLKILISEPHTMRVSIDHISRLVLLSLSLQYSCAVNSPM